MHADVRNEPSTESILDAELDRLAVWATGEPGSLAAELDDISLAGGVPGARNGVTSAALHGHGGGRIFSPAPRRHGQACSR